MNEMPLNKQPQNRRHQILNPRRTKQSKRKKEHAGQLIAEIHRCQNCNAWWGSSEYNAPQTHLVVHLLQQQAANFPWVDYRGWRRGNGKQECPACSQESAVAELSLRLGDNGVVQWPAGYGDVADPAPEKKANAFAAYISHSERIAENIDFITAREAQQEKHTAYYTADIDDIREELEAMRAAFKNILYRYAAILPPGWRVIGDYDKWLKKQACAGFLHGEMTPDISLMVGGHCRTVADIEMELDRLHRYVCDLTI